MKIDGIITPKKAKLVRKIVKFGAVKLGIPTGKINLIFLFLRSYGSTHIRSQEISIDKCLEGEDLIYTLFHELVHLRQILNGKLTFNGVVRWEGEAMCGGYWSQPYEIEARKLGKELTEEFKSSGMKRL